MDLFFGSLEAWSYVQPLSNLLYVFVENIGVGGFQFETSHKPVFLFVEI